MLHPSYHDLMSTVNSEVETGEAPIVNSRYSIVLATAKRARQLIDGVDALSEPECPKPLSVAIDELAQGEIHVLSDEEAQAARKHPESDGEAQAAEEYSESDEQIQTTEEDWENGEQIQTAEEHPESGEEDMASEEMELLEEELLPEEEPDSGEEPSEAE